MSYVCILIAAIIAGIGYAELERRSIWDNVEMGCLNGCLVACGALTAFGILWLAVAMRWGYWLHSFCLVAGFCGTLLVARFLEWLGELWNEGKEEDDDSS